MGCTVFCMGDDKWVDVCKIISGFFCILVSFIFDSSALFQQTNETKNIQLYLPF